MTTIAFIGLGHMGHPMAKNLLRAGFNVQVFDLLTSAMQSMAELGAKSATSIPEVVKNATVIITMLQTGDQVKEVCLGRQGFFHLNKDALYIDCSSIEIDVSRELHQKAADLGIAMLDAPVSGGVAGAEEGRLTFMVGGEEKIFNQAQPYLEKMGKKIIYAGPAGNGQAAKICNNLILGISMIAVSEGFALAEKLGLEAKKFFDISSNASGQCWSMTSYCPVPGLVEKSPANNHFKPGFTNKMMLKDLRLAQHAAESVHAVTPLGAEAAELYNLFINQGFGDLDFSAIIRLFKEKE